MFNRIYKGVKFYKFLNNDLIHHGLTYHIGLNIDPKPFNPTGECSSGGLYFCEESKCHMYFENYDYKVALIEIPNDAQVYVEDNKFKADRLILKEIKDFRDSYDDMWINIIPIKPYVLRYVKDQTKEMCEMALRYDGSALLHIKNQTPELCAYAVKQNGLALQYIYRRYQPEELCILAITQNVNAFRYVYNQTEELCILAVTKNGLMLQFVKDQTDEICKCAVKQNGLALRFVKNQTDEICEIAIEQTRDALELVKI